MTKAWTKSLLPFIFVALAAAGDRAQAQSYPSGPVKVISDSAPGSAPDVILRIVADRLGQVWGQQIVVMNQPGAGGSVAARAAAGSTPDGYTLFVAVSSTFRLDLDRGRVIGIEPVLALARQRLLPVFRHGNDRFVLIGKRRVECLPSVLV
jgi:tripartite-type tricarboxylate transporter receptor subunit TctC